MLGAGAVLATLAAAPALSQTSTPIRTLYIAKPGQTLPQTTFVRTRDCLRRPRSCVNVHGLRVIGVSLYPVEHRAERCMDDRVCSGEADQNQDMSAGAIAKQVLRPKVSPPVE